jgi:hypothetical protein
MSYLALLLLRKSNKKPNDYCRILQKLHNLALIFCAVVWFGSSPTSSPLFRLQVVSLSQSSCVCRQSRLLTGLEGKRVGQEPNHTTARSLALYKSFNTLCIRLCRKNLLGSAVYGILRKINKKTQWWLITPGYYKSYIIWISSFAG